MCLLLYLVTNGQEARNLSGHLPATNNVSLLPTNLTDGNNAIWIEQCGEDKRTVERARNLAKAAANVARFDSILGTRSPHGFTAMFKEDVWKNNVWLYLSSVYENNGLRGLRPDPAHATPPRLVCVQPNSATIYKSLQLTYDPWERCHSQQTRHPASLNAFYTFGTAYIFLCPDFLNQPLAPLGNHCPTVENNVFLDNAFAFYQDYQMYTLMYQLIRFYLQENTLRSELFGMNNCVGMSAESSARNPTNFVLYTACESDVFFLCSIVSLSTCT